VTSAVRPAHAGGYETFFGLREAPFSLAPDPRFLFASASHSAALGEVFHALERREPLVVITGEVGTGKTLLCRQLLRSVGSIFQTAYIPNPYLEPMALLLELAVELGADTRGVKAAAPLQQQHVLLKALTKRLMSLAQSGRRVLVCLDEVQAMPIDTLEALRLLTNLETEKRKLVQVVIFGQPELDARLDHPSVRQLKQRITFDYRLRPLTGAEMARYLDHRMAVAGYAGSRLFSPAALWVMKRRTGGFPRLVNIVAHKALISAYGKGRKAVGLRDMLSAVSDTSTLRISMREKVMGGLLVCCLGLIGIGLARIV
jgi:MSHA biogenesis protein MshM